MWKLTLTLGEIVVVLYSANKTLFLVIDFMNMVIRQLFEEEKNRKIKAPPPPPTPPFGGTQRI